MEVFGRYQVIHPIAKGGMAEIVLARPMSGARRHCALKRILPAFSCDEHFVSMFIDEARITIGLSHPKVVRLDDFGQVDGVYFMAIEYVDGSDLGALLRTQVRAGTALPPIVAAAIVRDVAAEPVACTVRRACKPNTLIPHEGRPNSRPSFASYDAVPDAHSPGPTPLDSRLGCRRLADH